jgi:hypothetical protein
MTDESLQYHSQRAMAELDLALKASNAEAARAHFRLSSLHLEKSQMPGTMSAAQAATQQF